MLCPVMSWLCGEGVPAVNADHRLTVQPPGDRPQEDLAFAGVGMEPPYIRLRQTPDHFGHLKHRLDLSADRHLSLHPEEDPKSPRIGVGVPFRGGHGHPSSFSSFDPGIRIV